MRIIIAIAVLLTVTGCSFTHRIQKDISQHCVCDTATNPFAGKLVLDCNCDSLYAAHNVASKCSELKVSFDASTASGTIRMVCEDITISVTDFFKDLFNSNKKK